MPFFVKMKSRVEKILMKFASIGMDEKGGVNRVIGTPQYRQAAEEMKKYMQELNMESYIDTVLNVHGIYNPGQKSKEIIIASHLDTVKEGGKFDGLYGVVGALEVVRRLQEEKKDLEFGIHIIATNGEEGNDLGGTFGSRCLVGMVDVSDSAYIAKAESMGFTKEDILNAEMDFDSVMYYLELHIEQGNTLYENQEEIGIVTGIVGLQRYEITVNGISNHAGTTMMQYRKDALVDASRIIDYGDRLAKSYGNNFVATFNKMQIHPNIVAVISDQVKMVLECRNLKEDLMENYICDMKKNTEGFNDVTWSPVVKKAPVACEPYIIDKTEEACKKLGVKYRKMPSGATHDGNSIAMKIPIGMIFVPSKDGISHARPEYTSWDQCEKGVDVLYQTILNL